MKNDVLPSRAVANKTGGCPKITFQTILSFFVLIAAAAIALQHDLELCTRDQDFAALPQFTVC